MLVHFLVVEFLVIFSTVVAGHGYYAEKRLQLNYVGWRCDELGVCTRLRVPRSLMQRSDIFLVEDEH